MIWRINDSEVKTKGYNYNTRSDESFFMIIGA